MLSRKIASAVILICCVYICYSQDRNSNWCFGDSTGIEFNGTSTSLFTSHVKSRGSSVSISDSSGQLLFYAFTRATLPGNTTLVYNRDHVLMQNGSNIVGRGWYQELVIIPDPSDSMKFYLFSVGETTIFGLYYSVIDMTLDSGRGAVITKNVQLQSYQAADDLVAIKHGNGRDWWVISGRRDAANDEFYEYLITPSGLSGPFIYHEGDTTNDGFKWITFSKSGNKFIVYDPTGLIQIFNFERCSGTMTLATTVRHDETAAPYPHYWGAEFSPNEQLLYVTKFVDSIPVYPCYLIQFDLNAPDIYFSADTIWRYDTTPATGSKLRLAPDGKIYLSCIWQDGINFPFPYPDSVFNVVNNNLSVINDPDNLGAACNFQPFSFNLGGGRCYNGLPNNPDYELGAVVNSICDTVTAVTAVGSGSKQEELHVFYHPGWQVAFINAEGLRGRKFNLQVLDLFGRVIYIEDGSLSSAYFTKDLPFDAFANGMYIVTLRTDKEALSKKFIKPAGR